MALRLLGSVWDPDSHANADWFSTSRATAVLLDGAAPLAASAVTKHANDAVWLVRRFVELFEAPAASRTPDLRERSEHARARCAAEYRTLRAQAGATDAEAPFACLGIVHDAGPRLDLFNMGDLTTLVLERSGSVRRFGESRVRELDALALDGLRREIALGTAPHALRLERVRPQLSRNRAAHNVMPGYDVLDVEAPCASRFEQLSLARHEVVQLLMVSDGFYRLVDTYRCYTDASLFDAVQHRGLEALLAELRELERGDAECVAYPRFKCHDDATALWLE